VESFVSSLLIIALAEMGDKTQLVALALAGRYRTVTVAAGVCLGVLVTNLFAAACGTLIGAALPVTLIKFVAGFAFIGFAVWTFLDKCEDESCDIREGRNPLLSIATAFFVAELGDKTQLTALTLAADTGEFFSVWAGSSLGMMLAVTIAIALGSIAQKSLPERTVKVACSIVFAVFGILTVLEAVSSLG
jgi:putative Ca2+/H+ antiporter (TMEM165/GDT1 family)